MTNELSGVNSEGSSFVDIDLELVASVADEAAAISNEPSDICAELYDSETTHHISPYCELFKNYAFTPPKPLNTADEPSYSVWLYTIPFLPFYHFLFVPDTLPHNMPMQLPTQHPQAIVTAHT